MKILNSIQSRDLDQKTIKFEPINSLDLMERASQKITEWIINNFSDENIPYHIFCGPGNNGGDGLAVARMLHQQHRRVTVYLDKQKIKTEDALSNFRKLPTRGYLTLIDLNSAFTRPSKGIIVDALFGSGLTRALEGYWAELVTQVNNYGLPVISIDIPSGMFGDKTTTGEVIRADYTLCLQAPKLACLIEENALNTGSLQILDIGLHQSSLDEITVQDYLIDARMVRSFLPVRASFSHKGTYGHALLVCGGHGKVGAALLAARACLRAGTGKLTVHVPGAAYQIMQLGVPEAMIEVDAHDYFFSACADLSKFQSIGIGCGLGQHSSTAQGLKSLLESADHPLVIDADALNILSQNQTWLQGLPRGSILTPHPGEYKRLFKSSNESFSRIEEQRNLSKTLGVFIVYKTAHTCITTPEGTAFYNLTGNPGMATAGSGDVLTGMITGFLAQKLPVENAVLTAVYLHGLAGDMASEQVGEYGLIASDIINHIGMAIKQTMHEK